MMYFVDSAELSFDEHGAQRFYNAVADDLSSLRAVLDHLPTDQAGTRLNGLDDLRPFLRSNGSIGSLAADLIGSMDRAVRAILFDKNGASNWSLAWHQDRIVMAGFWNTRLKKR